MLTRLWRNYWAGTWLMPAGLALVPLCWLAARVVYRLHYRLVGVAVWAYRFHPEPH
jgi:hypothetical protein